jgi:hypothetical protein
MSKPKKKPGAIAIPADMLATFKKWVKDNADLILSQGIRPTMKAVVHHDIKARMKGGKK